MHSLSVVLLSIAVPLRKEPKLTGRGVPGGTGGNSFTVATSNCSGCCATSVVAMRVSRKTLFRLEFILYLDTVYCLVFRLLALRLQPDLRFYDNAGKTKLVNRDRSVGASHHHCGDRDRAVRCGAIRALHSGAGDTVSPEAI